MFQFPSPPDTLVTRQVECVCCRELFTVAEDVVNLTPGLSEFWRMSPDQYTDIRQRFDPRIGRKPIIPETRAEPQSKPHPILHQRRGQRAHINCPRCGADNRNWVHITTPPIYSPAFGLDRVWARFPTAVWGLIAAGIIIFAGVLLASQTSQSRSQTVLLLIFALIGAVIPFFVITGMWQKQRIYNLERKHNQSRLFAPALSAGLSIFFIIVVFLPLFIYFLMPTAINKLKPAPTLEDRIDTVLVSLAPAVFNASAQDQILLDNATVTLQAILDENQFDCQSASFSAMITTLEAMLSSNNSSAYDLLLLQAINNLHALRDSGPECRPELLQTAIFSLQALLNTCGVGGRPPLVVVTPTPPITTLPGTGKGVTNKRAPEKITEAPKAQTTTFWPCNFSLLSGMIFQLKALQEAPPLASSYDKARHALEGSRWLALTSKNRVELDLISKQVGIFEKVISGGSAGNGRASNLTAVRIWVLVIGSSNLVATLLAIAAVNGFIEKINRHLPRPIGHSIANMTKVVIYDLRRALDIPDEALQHIEWTHVNRNLDGGIELKGVFLPPDRQDTNPSLAYIRTQCYSVCTNYWARIIHADVQFCRIPKLPVYPGESRMRMERASEGQVDSRQDTDEYQKLFRGRIAEPKEGASV
ncbi:MAG: DUF4199 domain-containing protein [Chloroflexi bacterium]|nr:DUF4199 domain-containing protein [Chloroflexota bacterium]